MKFKAAAMAALVGLALPLAACDFSGGGTTQASIAAIVDQVASITKSTCAFVPTATTIANIVAKNDAGISSAVQIATAICASVKTAKGQKMGGAEGAAPDPMVGFTAPPVAGVPVEGTLLR